MWLRYWGKIVDDYSAMRWPCPEGFHTPMIWEWQWINTIMTWLNIWNGEDWGNYLKLPFAWYIDYGGVDWVTDIGYCGYYWTCSPDQSNLVHEIYFDDTDGAADISYLDEKGYASSIRPFKDTFVVPTASWTVLAWTLGGAWVFYDATLWLISITSNWTTGYTMADKNVWATVVYNYWDALSDANCGKYFQRWNNYWFTWNSITTTSSTQVDASWYWPWNYYSSSTFITDYGDWSSVPNDNLRWWVTWVQQRPAPIVKRYYGWKIVNDYSAMRWPCPEGFHVPSKDEWVALYNIWADYEIWDSSDAIETCLKMPFSGYRLSWTWVSSQGTSADYWSSTHNATRYAYCFHANSTAINAQNSNYRSYALSIRPFKDVPVKLESPVNPWWDWVEITRVGMDFYIFHSTSLWVITIMYRDYGWEYITIADKNLGATTVYNVWDTLSESNCGKYYQRWNNYWFPRTWTISNTSSTKVDAWSYWPWNYYSSSTYITATPRDTSNNRNLRWWETWVQQRPAEVIKVYKWNTLIREKP